MVVAKKAGVSTENEALYTSKNKKSDDDLYEGYAFSSDEKSEIVEMFSILLDMKLEEEKRLSN